MVAGLIAISVGAVALALTDAMANSLAEILATTLIFLLIFGYYVIFEALWQGQTPGKRLVRIRVLKRAGYPIGFVDSLVRNLVRIADFLPVFYGVGIVTMFLSAESRRLGDYAAGTVVVRERAPVSLADLTSSARPAPGAVRGAIDPEELSWDLAALPPEDLRLADELLGRIDSLRPEAGRRLAERVAEQIAARIGARAPLNPIQFLRRVVELAASESS